MTNYELNEGKMFTDITDGIAIVINSETGIYYGMNGLGTVVFEALTNGASKENVLEGLKSLAEVPEDIETRLNSFIKEMLNWEIIIEGGNSNGSASFDLAIAKEDEFVMEIKEYNDAQELLLADPIHEVKEETGWTPEKNSIGYDKEETKAREEKVEE